MVLKGTDATADKRERPVHRVKTKLAVRGQGPQTAEPVEDKRNLHYTKSGPGRKHRYGPGKKRHKLMWG